MTSLQEAVRAPRHSLNIFVASSDEMAPLGRTRNVSTSGMFLETQVRPQVGSVQRLSLVWGDDIIECCARIVRHAQDGVGIAFMEADAAFRVLLGEMLAATNN